MGSGRGYTLAVTDRLAPVRSRTGKAATPAADAEIPAQFSSLRARDHQTTSNSPSCGRGRKGRQLRENRVHHATWKGQSWRPSLGELAANSPTISPPCERCDYVGSTSGVPQIADDPSRRSTRPPWGQDQTLAKEREIGTHVLPHRAVSADGYFRSPSFSVRARTHDIEGANIPTP
jgi:hypothetical protein